MAQLLYLTISSRCTTCQMTSPCLEIDTYATSTQLNLKSGCEYGFDLLLQFFLIKVFWWTQSYLSRNPLSQPVYCHLGIVRHRYLWSHCRRSWYFVQQQQLIIIYYSLNVKIEGSGVRIGQAEDEIYICCQIITRIWMESTSSNEQPLNSYEIQHIREMTKTQI
ncbi:Hypothetical_protein [Hexamita inflata]|nr:Hypothetical protein HINF_LOCUS61298 [Hexamita inflata]